MPFDPEVYGPRAAEVLALGQDGERVQPLVIDGPWCRAAAPLLDKMRPADFPPGARNAQAAIAGLWLYFGFFDAAHAVVQDLGGAEGNYWHAILHRREPDAANARYWFRYVGRHPVYEELQRRAKALGWKDGPLWDPVEFVSFCDRARKAPEASDERLAKQIQHVEWQLLFHFCATAPGAPGV